jgi:hypothetical protein
MIRGEGKSEDGDDEILVVVGKVCGMHDHDCDYDCDRY